MYPINDRQYLKICAEIAKERSKTIQEKIQVAQNVLKICEKNDGDKLSSSRILDKLILISFAISAQIFRYCRSFIGYI